MGRLILICFFCLGLAAGGFAQSPSLKPGDRLPELSVGARRYEQIEIKSINARTVVFLHRGGLASLRLRDLPPEWQTRFNYDPSADASAETALTAPATQTVPRVSPSKPAPVSTFEAVLRQFGQPVTLRPEVDLRPQYFQLGLSVKDQGRRPSCAIFAVVSALEYLNAQLTGRPEKLSEEYLSWAVRQTMRRPAATGATQSENTEDRDDGFALSEVVAALRAYGIPPQSQMPNTFGQALSNIKDPPAALIEEARGHQHVFIHNIPGRDGPTLVNNLIHALNAGLPVPVGMAWPNYRTLRNAYLDRQKPLAAGGHAVTLVGYRTATGRIEDATFIFKNSWGAGWGQGGYGVVTYRYLSQHLFDAIMLEIQAPSPTVKQ